MKLADPTLLKHQCLIDGAWVGEGVDAIHNPATGALIAKVPRFGYAETVRANPVTGVLLSRQLSFPSATASAPSRRSRLARPIRRSCRCGKACRDSEC